MNTDSQLFDLVTLKKQGLKAGELLAVDPEIYEKFMFHSSKVVKRDETTRNMVFLTGISAYTKTPINLFLKGESGIGKTYNVTKMLEYFPKDDVWMLGCLSPKALIHEHGVLYDKEGCEIDLDERPGLKASKEEKRAWRERIRHSRQIIELQGKILVFLEAPYIETYNILRPILSHDKWEISYKFADKTRAGVLRTTHVVIRGWPATIFCSTQEKYVQDLATRGFTITPETHQAKYKEANVLTGEKAALPWLFKDDFDFKLLQGYIGWLRNHLKEVTVVVPYGRELGGVYPSEYARSMRDFKHLIALIQILAGFHYMQRPVLVSQYEKPIARLKKDGETVTNEEHLILATRKDYEHVLELWKGVEETTVSGLPGHIINFYHKAVEPLSEQAETFNYEDLTQEYNEIATEKKSSDTIRKWVKHLCDIGWTSKQPDPNDKRKVTIRILKKTLKNNGDYRIPQFTAFFSLEAFKKWLDDLKKISEQNTTPNIQLKPNLLAEEHSSIECIFDSVLCADNFLDHSKQESQPTLENKAEKKGFQHSPIVLKSLTVQETKPILTKDNLEKIWSHLPRQFEDGVFQEIAIKHGGLTREPADQLWKRLKAEEKFMRVDDGRFWTLVK